MNSRIVESKNIDIEELISKRERLIEKLQSLKEGEPTRRELSAQISNLNATINDLQKTIAQKDQQIADLQKTPVSKPKDTTAQKKEKSPEEAKTGEENPLEFTTGINKEEVYRVNEAFLKIKDKFQLKIAEVIKKGMGKDFGIKKKNLEAFNNSKISIEGTSTIKGEFLKNLNISSRSLTSNNYALPITLNYFFTISPSEITSFLTSMNKVKESNDALTKAYEYLRVLKEASEEAEANTTPAPPEPATPENQTEENQTTQETPKEEEVKETPSLISSNEEISRKVNGEIIKILDQWAPGALKELIYYLNNNVKFFHENTFIIMDGSKEAGKPEVTLNDKNNVVVKFSFKVDLLSGSNRKAARVSAGISGGTAGTKIKNVASTVGKTLLNRMSKSGTLGNKVSDYHRSKKLEGK